jgi:hypothetical protein
LVEIVEDRGPVKGSDFSVEAGALLSSNRRRMAPSAACSVCGQEDSWRHSLVECAMSRCVWALSNPTIVEHICISTEPAARQWLFSMMRTMEHDDFIRLVVTL